MSSPPRTFGRNSWICGRSTRFRRKPILIVTHNIDEAVSLADRILVFGANPGHIRVELKGLPQADRRAKKGPVRARLVDTIYQIMTNPELDAAELVQQRSMTARGAEPKTGGSRARRYQTLPDVSIDDLTGFVQYLASIGGRGNMHDLARDLQMRTDDLLALVEATDILGLADMQERQVLLTPAGLSDSRMRTSMRRRRSSARSPSSRSLCSATSCASSRPVRRTRWRPSGFSTISSTRLAVRRPDASSRR